MNRLLAAGLMLGLLDACSQAEPRPDGGRDESSSDEPDARRDGGRGRDAGRRDAGSDAKPPPFAEPSATQQLEKVTIDACAADNAAKLSAGDVEKLLAEPAGTTGRWLYPYDGTVFPRGLEAPTMMWEGARGAAVHVRIRSPYFDYDGCLPSSEAGTLRLPQDVWEVAGAHTLGPKTPFEISLRTIADGKVSGPGVLRVVIAQATLKGSIFYNSYNSSLGGPLAGLGIGGGGSVLRIRPGNKAEFFVRQGACVGCHTVSANGERLIAKDFGGLADGFVYALGADAAPNPPTMRGTANAAFTGISPDGAVFINTAIRSRVGPNITGAAGTPPIDIDAVLTETDTGTAVANSGVPKGALMPTFSPDGTRLTFNDYAAGAGAGVSLMQYDAKGRVATGLRALWQGKDGFAGWPFFLPDNGAIVFTWGAERNFSGNGVGVHGFAIRGPRSDLMLVDADTGKASLLARAMGFATPDDAASDTTYLPFGAEELHQSYYPTVSPVAAGGFFWLFFDSVRHYGNKGLRRQLWGAAIAIRHGGELSDPDGLYANDPSFPAFYVPGQELETANHRAFTALDPCRADGEGCESGIDCCSSFCSEGTCSEPTGCSDANQGCKTDDDCCEDNLRCIAGYCGQILL